MAHQHDFTIPPSPARLRAEALFVAPPAPPPQLRFEGGPVIVIRKRRHVELPCEKVTQENDGLPEGMPVVRVHRIVRTEPAIKPVETPELHAAHVQAWDAYQRTPKRVRRSRPERRPSAVVSVIPTTVPAPVVVAESAHVAVPVRTTPSAEIRSADLPSDKVALPSAAPAPDVAVSWRDVEQGLASLRKLLDELAIGRALFADMEFLVAIRDSKTIPRHPVS